MNLRYAYLDRFPLHRFGSDGSVWHWKRKYWKQIKPTLGKAKDSYPAISLRDDATGKRERRAVHLLIAEAFHGPKPEGIVCRHFNGDRADAAISNLVYGTRVENEADKRRHGRALTGERHHQVKLSEETVRKIRNEWSAVPLPELAVRFSVTKQAIWRIRHRRTWRHVA